MQEDHGRDQSQAAHEEHIRAIAAELGARGGRPRLSSEPGPAKRVSVSLTDEQLAWLDSQGGSRSAALRSLVETAMEDS